MRPRGPCSGSWIMLERGKKTDPSLPTLRKLAKALGVPVTELLSDVSMEVPLR